MTRTVTVGGMTLDITQELTVVSDAKPRVRDDDYALMAYVSEARPDCDEGVDSWFLESSLVTYEGAVTVTAATDPSTVSQWQLGFAQNVLLYDRFAAYEGNNSLDVTETFQFGSPLRDGDDKSLPFYGLEGDAVGELKLGETVTVEATDSPTWALPKTIERTGASGALASTRGANDFMIWLMLAYSPTGADQRQIVLLGHADWGVDWTTITQNGTPVWTTAVTGVHAPVVELESYSSANLPPLGTGTTIPDLRNLNGNTYRQGVLAQGTSTVVKWIYNENDCAVEWQPAENPAGVANWLDGA